VVIDTSINLFTAGRDIMMDNLAIEKEKLKT
jgi:hypothetical protein